MKSIATWLFLRDQEFFLQLRLTFHSNFLEENAGIFGDLNAWIPMFVFLAIALYLSKPTAGVFSMFFGLAAFILSFQASMLLANFFYQPSPVRLEEVLHGFQLPAMGRANDLSMPDWAIASLVATFQFAALRMRHFGGSNIRLGWLAIIVFIFFRVYAGYTYPIGVLMAVLIGMLIGWLMFQLARNVELLSPSLSGKEDEDNASGDDTL